MWETGYTESRQVIGLAEGNGIGGSDTGIEETQDVVVHITILPYLIIIDMYIHVGV